jgi:chromosome segregation protein
MLKRLELVGFKSFADRTEFVFAPGVTGIVGPNGSGKSNIVDAVRWVLGEQSAKSLRGGEMADVIFNGSATRRSVGLAEVTMTFDNSRRALATEAEEVQVGRRVYRGGESEYLINGQVCRLKDVKDLFLGSGAGADAYCIIEQGRVDVLLQASTQERRTIFEEAAGVSRFRAKKTETLRRLERVDQNLQRLKDIVDEVDKQLRSVQLQAAKAQRSRDYTARLKELRVALGLREYGRLTDSLDAKTREFAALRDALRQEAEQADAWERELRELEKALTSLDEAARASEAELSAARQQVAAEETTQAHSRAQAEELDEAVSRMRLRFAEQTRCAAALAEAVSAADRDVQGGESDAAVQRWEVDRCANELRDLDARLQALREQVRREKDQHYESMRQTARLQNDAVSYRAQVDNLTREHERLRQRSEQAEGRLASLDVELQELTAADEALQARLGDSRKALAAMREEHDRLEQVRDETAQRVADLRAQRSGLASRIEVLEGLERSREGFGAGAREVFDLMEQADPGPWRTVLGIVADFLTVRREYAPLIDLALGERAQRFLVREFSLLAQALRQRVRAFSSRVCFLPVWPAGSAPGEDEKRITAAQAPVTAAGVVAPAAELVRCDHPDFSDLPRRLLGRTLIVRDLDAAHKAAAQADRVRCVTLRGELLEADGALTVGDHHAASGILSRKSELRELRERQDALDLRLADLDRDLADLRERMAALDDRIGRQQLEIDVLADQSADLRERIGQRRQRRQGLHEEVAVNRSEISGLEQEIAGLEASWRWACDEAAQAEAQVQALQARLETAENDIREGDEQRLHRQQDATAAKVALAQVDERLAALRTRHAQLEADLQQREQERVHAEQALEEAAARRAENGRLVLQTSAALAAWYLRKEDAERRLAEHDAERRRLRLEKSRRGEEAQVNRGGWRERQEQAHARELEVNELRHRRDVLCDRLREDYQLEISQLHHQASETADPRTPPPEVDAAVAEEEVAELRRKLARLGSVNMDAIQELNDLETRGGTLRIQYDDLAAAQRSLQDIIARINADSRRLFQETFTVVRQHFQELFRKLFGGGMADVVLEDEIDVLDSGVEIVARPPGKELRSISLMSGGEKTLTAVALLLAIFQSKPSPFCILDEVDAALDEANIGRFTNVLREFLDRSQFILVTHSKRTMACADVLYGVTMQESGVSRRIAVRFEEWPDDEREDAKDAA